MIFTLEYSVHACRELEQIPRKSLRSEQSQFNSPIAIIHNVELCKVPHLCSHAFQMSQTSTLINYSKKKILVLTTFNTTIKSFVVLN